MKKLINTPDLMLAESLAGFAAAHADIVSLGAEHKFVRRRELQPGKKIVFTWQWQDDETWENHFSVVTVELDDADGGTELRLKHQQLPNEESRDGHNRGWNSALDKLEKFFRK